MINESRIINAVDLEIYPADEVSIAGHMYIFLHVLDQANNRLTVRKLTDVIKEYFRWQDETDDGKNTKQDWPHVIPMDNDLPLGFVGLSAQSQ